MQEGGRFYLGGAGADALTDEELELVPVLAEIAEEPPRPAPPLTTACKMALCSVVLLITTTFVVLLWEVMRDPVS